MATSVDSTNYATYSYGPSSPGVLLCNTGEKLGAFGTVPVVQQTAATAFAAGDSTNTMGAAINAINTALKAYGLTV